MSKGVSTAKRRRQRKDERGIGRVGIIHQELPTSNRRWEKKKMASALHWLAGLSTPKTVNGGLCHVQGKACFLPHLFLLEDGAPVVAGRGGWGT